MSRLEWAGFQPSDHSRKEKLQTSWQWMSMRTSYSSPKYPTQEASRSTATLTTKATCHCITYEGTGVFYVFICCALCATTLQHSGFVSIICRTMVWNELVQCVGRPVHGKTACHRAGRGSQQSSVQPCPWAQLQRLLWIWSTSESIWRRPQWGPLPLIIRIWSALLGQCVNTTENMAISTR
jgi:hypothetical protein